MSNLKNKLKDVATDLEEVNQFGNKRIIEIDINKLEGHELSHYSITDVERLAEWIEIVGFILNPLIVVKNGSNYTIESGHKRKAAATLLKYKTVPCIIADDKDEVLRIIAANQHRVISKEEKKVEIERMREILKEKGITNINEKIAELFDVDVRTIYRNASDSTKEELDPIDEDKKQKRKNNKIIADLEKNIIHFSHLEIAFVKEIIENNS
ncbi:ParB N-terminal domain-containing protein [Erysipelotrichaceae bacterium OttesenSCG-928-M19]|nr:ParB N-terminal domain-containing protein [Erysipelotrichaceae bacterium OttesenSCG-928-M19]